MNVIEAIEKRRSIRKFTLSPIPRDDIKMTINSGMQAPSAKNRKPWRFVIIQDAARKGMLDAVQKWLEREGGGSGFAGERETTLVMHARPWR